MNIELFYLPEDFTEEQAQQYLNMFTAFQDVQPPDEVIAKIYSECGGEEGYLEIKKIIAENTELIYETYPELQPQNLAGVMAQMKPERDEIKTAISVHMDNVRAIKLKENLQIGKP
jgi:hypothetical protein